jgi:hypothetical protein
MAKKAEIRMRLAAAVLAMAAFAGGCGSGGDSAATASTPGTGPAIASATLQWTPPSTYFDKSPLNPQVDLDHYEIFVSESPNFTDNDAPVAAVAAVTLEDGKNGQAGSKKPTSSFDLANIAALVQPGKVYYVSVRAIGIDNQASSFSPAAEWDLG